VDGLVRPWRAEWGDVQASRARRLDRGFDDGDIFARNERNDVGGDDLVVEPHREKTERRNVLCRDDPDVCPRNRDDRTGTDAALAIGQRRHDHGTIRGAVG
jgi:hypothetical protein